MMRRIKPALTVAAVIAVAVVLSGGTQPVHAATSTARAASTHVARMTPAIGIDPHFRRAGKMSGSKVVFSCQTTTPVQCFGPAQMRTAYGYDKVLASGIQGQGQTIVIVDAFQAPTISHDLDLFDAAFGLPTPTLNIIAPDGLTPFDQDDADHTFWSGEISLDVEWAHAIAPKATIDLVLAKTDSDADFESALKYVADKSLGTVLSQSYSGAECDTDLAANVHASFQRMVANGTTPIAATGDQGPAQYSCGPVGFVTSAGNPASDPLVTAVGGTTLYAAGTTGAYQRESVWNQPDLASAGGSGLSTIFREPSFQYGVQHTGRRSVPDVAYNASTDAGVLIVWSTSGAGPDLAFVFGGTSAASPQWAATVALAAQVAHHRLGDINPAIYALGSSPLSSLLFHDTTVGNNTTTEPNEAGTDVVFSGPSATRGWDFVTGFGSPKADKLIPALALAAR